MSPRRELVAEVRAILDRHWVDAGYCAPNATVYPWQWLWDSCFHAIVWQRLGEVDRALTELASALSTQNEAGFVPHMNYQLDPGAHADFWGRRASSSITQPPMYGYAIAELSRGGADVSGELVERGYRGLRHLMRERARHLGSGLVLLCHPWETGADNSARWDGLCPPEFSVGRWRERKGELRRSIVYDSVGSPRANPQCHIASVAFNALIAFNAAELAAVFGFDDLKSAADELAEAIDARWTPELKTWADAGVTETSSARVRTIEALLPLLTTSSPRIAADVFGALDDPAHYGAPFGPTGAHRAEPTYRGDEYWRGATWPQINYLLWLAAIRHGHAGAQRAIARATIAAALQSNFAEYWNPDTGEGRGAIPQSWTGLVIAMTSS